MIGGTPNLSDNYYPVETENGVRAERHVQPCADRRPYRQLSAARRAAVVAKLP